MDSVLQNTLNTVVSNATPLVIAALGETITERAGVINLSLDGSLALSAMVGFVAAYAAQRSGVSAPVALALGVTSAALIGALMALIIAWGGITLRRDQVAVGFILTLLAADLAQFLGQDYTRIPGPTFPTVPVPFLVDLPVVGPILFRHSLFVYFSYVLLIVCWWWLFRTQGGLAHRAIGERPASAYARGVDVNGLRYLYTILGGALVGVAGAAFSLNLKPGWANPPSMRGDGWIALAIVIFGGWHPFRVLLGAYLFAALRAFASAAQRSGDVGIPLVLLNAIPWLAMILTLVFVSSGVLERLLRVLPRAVQNRARALLRSDPPAALGTRFEP
ncbi:MAG: ABC transporter permease [Anaerolineae bacterium]|nr:ABC transporter permease [Anaerolineae bacterium]MDW8171589.1 ABC transporter permease [Anaerolineae bacterium]